MDIEKAITEGIEEEKLYHRTSWLGFGQNESRYPKKTC